MSSQNSPPYTNNQGRHHDKDSGRSLRNSKSRQLHLDNFEDEEGRFREEHEELRRQFFSSSEAERALLNDRIKARRRQEEELLQRQEDSLRQQEAHFRDQPRYYDGVHVLPYYDHHRGVSTRTPDPESERETFVEFIERENRERRAEREGIMRRSDAVPESASRKEKRKAAKKARVDEHGNTFSSAPVYEAGPSIPRAPGATTEAIRKLRHARRESTGIKVRAEPKATPLAEPSGSKSSRLPVPSSNNFAISKKEPTSRISENKAAVISSPIISPQDEDQDWEFIEHPRYQPIETEVEDEFLNVDKDAIEREIAESGFDPNAQQRRGWFSWLWK